MTNLIRYNEPFESMWRLFDTPSVWRQPAFDSRFEVEETEDAYILRADVPGMKQDDIDIEVVGDTVSVSGERKLERKNEESTYWTYERSYGSFRKSYRLPGGDFDKVDASLADGVLTIEVPKRAEHKPRKVPLKGIGEKVKGLFGKADKAKHEAA